MYLCIIYVFLYLRILFSVSLFRKLPPMQTMSNRIPRIFKFFNWTFSRLSIVNIHSKYSKLLTFDSTLPWLFLFKIYFFYFLSTTQPEIPEFKSFLKSCASGYDATNSQTTDIACLVSTQIPSKEIVNLHLNLRSNPPTIYHLQ